MFAALIGAVRKRPVPPQFFLANLRTVIGRHDAPFERLEMPVPWIGRGTRISGPSAAGAGVRKRVQQKILVVSRQITKRCFKSADAFAVQISQGVQERSLRLG